MGQEFLIVRQSRKEPVEAIPVPILGPDLMDPRKFALIKEVTHRPPEQIEESQEG